MTHLRVEVLPQRDRRAHDASQVEYRPEYSDELALLAFGRVCKHQRTLRRPEQSCTNAQDTACRDDEPSDIWVNIHGSVTGRSNAM